MSRIPKGRFLSMLEGVDYAPLWQHCNVFDSRTGQIGIQLNKLVYRYDDEHWNKYYPPNEIDDRDLIVAMSPSVLKREKLKVQTKPFILKTP